VGATGEKDLFRAPQGRLRGKKRGASAAGGNSCTRAKSSSKRRLEIFVNLPIGFASNGSAIVIVPVDRVVWTQRTVEITGKLVRDIPKPVPVKQVEIWITGEASPRARERISAQQVTLVERAGQRLPLMD
jgi:hypothetical protein